MAGPWLAETESGHRLPTDTIRRLACDSRVEWVLESEGRPVGIGRRGRQVPEPIHRILRHRDGGRCRFPGCERKRWLRAPPPRPLGRRRSHEPRQPGPPVPRPPPANPRGRVADQRPSGLRPQVPRSGRQAPQNQSIAGNGDGTAALTCHSRELSDATQSPVSIVRCDSWLPNASSSQSSRELLQLNGSTKMTSSWPSWTATLPRRDMSSLSRRTMRQTCGRSQPMMRKESWRQRSRSPA
jgi:hypothetical protein